MFDAAIFDAAIFDTANVARTVVAGGRKLTFAEAEALYEAQTRRQSLPDIEPQPEPRKARKAAVAPASAQDDAPARAQPVSFPPIPQMLPLPDLAAVQARIQEAQRAAAQAQINAAERNAQDEAMAVAMLLLMMEAA